MKADNSTVYGAMLLDMLHDADTSNTPYPLGEGYSIIFYSGDGICNGYIVMLNGSDVAECSDVLYVDRPHIADMARLLYTQRDAIVARYLARLDAARPAAEKRLAQEM